MTEITVSVSPISYGVGLATGVLLTLTVSYLLVGVVSLSLLTGIPAALSLSFLAITLIRNRGEE